MKKRVCKHEKEFGNLVQVFKDLYAFKGDEKKQLYPKMVL